MPLAGTGCAGTQSFYAFIASAEFVVADIIRRELRLQQQHANRAVDRGRRAGDDRRARSDTCPAIARAATSWTSPALEHKRRMVLARRHRHASSDKREVIAKRFGNCAASAASSSRKKASRTVRTPKNTCRCILVEIIAPGAHATESTSCRRCRCRRRCRECFCPGSG